jgi:hypothetical protein
MIWRNPGIRHADVISQPDKFRVWTASHLNKLIKTFENGVNKEHGEEQEKGASIR